MKIIRVNKCWECPFSDRIDSKTRHCVVMQKEVNPKIIDPKCPLEDAPKERK